MNNTDLKMNLADFKEYSAISNIISNPIENKQKTFRTEFNIDINPANAIRAYNFVSNPIDINMPISFADYITQIQKGGLVESEDYSIMRTDEYTNVIITKSNGEPIKLVHWKYGDSAEHYDGYDDCFYSVNGDFKQLLLSYDKNNTLESREITYDNINDYNELLPKNIYINETPETYINKLKSNYIKYEIASDEYEDDKQVRINEFDDNNKLVKSIYFVNGPDINYLSVTDNFDDDSRAYHKVDLLNYGETSEIIVMDYLKKNNKQF